VALDLLIQLGVLDRDGGLVGQCAQKLLILLTERVRNPAVDREDADERSSCFSGTATMDRTPASRRPQGTGYRDILGGIFDQHRHAAHDDAPDETFAGSEAHSANDSVTVPLYA